MTRWMLCFCWLGAITMLVPVSLASVWAGSTCSRSFLMGDKARVKKRAASQRVARKKVQRRAKRRCRGKRLVYLSRWQYKCSLAKGLHVCRAHAKFRCCGTSKHSKAKRKRRRTRRRGKSKTSRRQALARRAKTIKKRRSNRKFRLAVAKANKKSARRITQSRARKRRGRRVANVSKMKAGTCQQARIEVKGYSRGETQRKAKLEARGAARIRALERCGNLHPAWMKRWNYRCARSGKRYVCSAYTVVRCCKR